MMAPNPRHPRVTVQFREVYDENFRFVWRVLRGLGIAPPEVADAVQEVFIVVHRRLADFEGRSKITTWLFSICVNVVNERRRAARSRPQLASLPEGHETPDDRADAQGHLERREAVATLDRVLAQLPEDQRIVFVLFEIEGVEGRDIAEAMGVPVATVHSRLRLARERFRAIASRLRAEERSLQPRGWVKNHA